MSLPPGIVIILVIFVTSMIISGIWIYTENKRVIQNPPPPPPESISPMERIRQKEAEDLARKEAQDAFFSRKKGETNQVEDNDW